MFSKKEYTSNRLLYKELYKQVKHVLSLQQPLQDARSRRDSPNREHQSLAISRNYTPDTGSACNYDKVLHAP